MAWSTTIPVKLFDVPRLVTFVDVTPDSIGPSAVQHGGPTSTVKCPRITILPLNSGTITSTLGVMLVPSATVPSSLSGASGSVTLLLPSAASTMNFRVYFEFIDQA